MRTLALSSTIFAAVMAAPLLAENRIDGQSADAPELSEYGSYAVGVRQFEFTNENQINISAVDPLADPAADLPVYDRPLTVEMWYPAAEGATGDTSINTYLRDGTTEVTLEGQAIRDAAPADTGEPAPLILLSHGYPGNRFLMSHLAENLASKGYAVAAIDHTDSTYNDVSAFSSTLVNRPLDQLFVLDQIAALNNDASSDFAGRIDTGNTGLVGYSMGGYGAVITAGAGLVEGASGFTAQGTLEIHEAGTDTHNALVDERIKTVVAIGPWGQNFGLWDDEGLAGIEIPTLFIAGSEDATSGYENGVRAIWEGAVNSDRALLTFDGAGHNAAAPIPAPEESFFFSDALGFNVSEHYSDPVWDTVFMNNVAQHFLTSWFGAELKGDEEYSSYLDLVENGSDGLFSKNDDGTFADDHTYWLGFEDGTAEGLRFETLNSIAAVPLPASTWLLLGAFGGLGVLRRTRRRA